MRRSTRTPAAQQLSLGMGGRQLQPQAYRVATDTIANATFFIVLLLLEVTGEHRTSGRQNQQTGKRFHTTLGYRRHSPKYLCTPIPRPGTRVMPREYGRPINIGRLAYCPLASFASGKNNEPAAWPASDSRGGIEPRLIPPRVPGSALDTGLTFARARPYTKLSSNARGGL